MLSLVNCLLHNQLLDQHTIQSATVAAREQKKSLISFLVNTKLINSRDLQFYLAQYFSLPMHDLRHYEYQENFQKILPHELVNRYRTLPIKIEGSTLTLCVSDPTYDNIFDTIKFHTGKNIALVIGDEILLEKALTTFHKPRLLLEKFLSEEQQPYHTEPEQDDAPIIEYVDHLILNAIEKQISDIHIEPFANHCRIRFRRDGLLYEAATLPSHAGIRVITRFKIMANLNIAERRLPQDGRIPWRRKNNIDIRLNSIPTLHGEKIALRLLDSQSLQLELTALGLSPNQLQKLHHVISKPQGLILVTGPTGSGKSATLYSILRELNQIEKNISTVEDPVEIDMPGINQININYKIGLDFPAVLRMLLRQDPDILMIGEIRDLETATIAIQAAQTGHLVFSTLHTNSTEETINRLHAMGIPHYQIQDSLTLIIAQRLVRVLCQHCKKRNADSSYQAVGCEQCHHGYRGRTGIFAFNENLWEIAQQKVSEGVTSQNEIQRIIMESPVNATF